MEARVEKFSSYLLYLVIILTAVGSFSIHAPKAMGEADRFDSYEIRVIRPRFMQKRQRFELGAQLVSVMNDTFVYTFLASGLLTFHFTESWALETAGAYGFSLDRESKEILFDDFDIKTQVFRTQYFGQAAVLWTPAYGKVQLPEGQLVYFDTFLAMGGGMTGVEWRYSDFCQKPDFERNPDADPVPSDATLTYPTFVYGIGQKIFRSRSSALRWDLRSHMIFYDDADGSCTPSTAESASETQNNITLHVGISKFF